MPKHYWSYALNAAFIIAAVQDGKVARRNRLKYQELIETKQGLVEALIQSQARVDYLVSLVNKNKPELDAFDLIALENLNMTTKPVQE